MVPGSLLRTGRKQLDLFLGMFRPRPLAKFIALNARFVILMKANVLPGEKLEEQLSFMLV